MTFVQISQMLQICELVANQQLSTHAQPTDTFSFSQFDSTDLHFEPARIMAKEATKQLLADVKQSVLICRPSSNKNHTNMR